MPFLLEIRFKMASSNIAAVMTSATLIAVTSASVTGKLLGRSQFYESSRISAVLLGATGLMTAAMLAVDNVWCGPLFA